MRSLRRLSLVALILAYGHIVFGAIVRITGSGMGCGDHWPRCQGHWFPPLDRIDLIIEVSHRYFAATLSLAILVLLAVAFRRRREPGVSGAGGVLRPAALATGLVIAAALFGAATVKLELTNPYVIVTHLAIAMALLATLIVALARAGGLGAPRVAAGASSARTARGAATAAGLTFLVLVLGALTAHIPGANAACPGFPWCRGDVAWQSAALHIQLTHRVLAFLLFFHTLGLAIAVPRRKSEAPVIRMLARASFATVLLQFIVAAALVEMHLPAVLRSLHEAVGTIAWVVIVAYAVLARRGVADALATDDAPAPQLAGIVRPSGVGA